MAADEAPGSPTVAVAGRLQPGQDHPGPAPAPGRGAPPRGGRRPGTPGLAILCGGEALPRSSWPTGWSARPGDGPLVNLYGPTETVDRLVRRSRRSSARRRAPVTIGRPIARTRAYVLDRRIRPVPLGVVGELYIGGAGVARGLPGPSGADGRAVRARPVRGQARVPALPDGRPGPMAGPTARSSASAGPTIRSRSAATASSWARSRRPWPGTRRSARPPSSPARIAPATVGSWPTWRRSRDASRHRRPTFGPSSVSPCRRR